MTRTFNRSTYEENEILRNKLTFAEKCIGGYESRINELLLQLAGAQAKPRGYGEGYEVREKLPEPSKEEWEGKPVYRIITINGERISDGYHKEMGFRVVYGDRVDFYPTRDIARWFPIPHTEEQK